MQTDKFTIIISTSVEYNVLSKSLHISLVGLYESRYFCFVLLFPSVRDLSVKSCAGDFATKVFGRNIFLAAARVGPTEVLNNLCDLLF